MKKILEIFILSKYSIFQRLKIWNIKKIKIRNNIMSRFFENQEIFHNFDFSQKFQSLTRIWNFSHKLRSLARISIFKIFIQKFRENSNIFLQIWTPKIMKKCGRIWTFFISFGNTYFKIFTVYRYFESFDKIIKKNSKFWLHNPNKDQKSKFWS